MFHARAALRQVSRSETQPPLRQHQRTSTIGGISREIAVRSAHSCARFQKSVGGKDKDGAGASERPTTSPRPKRKALIWIERVLLVSGLALVGVYGAARMESWVTSRAALKRFAADEALVQSSTGSDLDNLISNVESGSSEATRLAQCRLQSLGRTSG